MGAAAFRLRPGRATTGRATTRRSSRGQPSSGQLQPFMRLFIVDDHELIREGLRAVATRLEGVSVVGEAGDGVRALERIPDSGADVALLDLSLPGMDGIALTAALRARCPALRVLVISMHDDPAHVRGALAAGASGYLLKDTSHRELALALDAVRAGGRFLSPGVAAEVIRGYVEEGGGGLAHGGGAQRARDGGAVAGPGPSPEAHATLTSRQLEVLRALADGQATRTIARRLGLSVKTVETHRANIMERLDIADLAGLVRWAVRHGVVDDD